MADSSTGSRTPAYVAALGERNRLLAELRRRGARGGVIALHRSMVSGRLTASLALSTIVVPLLLTGFVLLALRPLGDAWLAMLGTFQRLLELPGDVVSHSVPLGRVFSFSIPSLSTTASLPTAQEYTIVGVTCALALAVSAFLPRRFLPIAYYLRFGTLVQLTAFLYFEIGRAHV